MSNNSSTTTKAIPQHIDKARVALLKAMTAVDRARSTRGQPGGLAELVAAEIASGVFVAEHGRAILDYILLKEGLTPVQQGAAVNAG